MKLTGLGASDGVVVGPAFVHAAGELEPTREKIVEDSVEEEVGRFRRAVRAVVLKLSETAAILAGELAPEVSIFSVGTNDLIQYTLAADRGNERLARLQSADHPAVLKLIENTCEAAREAEIWVGVCGEEAGEPALIPTLVRLGVTEPSMSAPSIPRAKKVVSEL